jgi:hypothetical protein
MTRESEFLQGRRIRPYCLVLPFVLCLIVVTIQVMKEQIVQLMPHQVLRSAIYL